MDYKEHDSMLNKTINYEPSIQFKILIQKNIFLQLFSKKCIILMEKNSFIFTDKN